MSQSFYSRAHRGFAKAMIVAGVASVAMMAPAAAQSPFASLAGTWSGGGTIAMMNGASERLRCRVSYSVAPSGASLYQQLRCASDSYKFEVQSRVILSGDGLSGTWREITRNAEGNVSGSVSDGEIRAHVDGTGFTAELSISTRGNRQSVTITPQGADVRAVTVDLRRG
jgi:hypothetical protein